MSQAPFTYNPQTGNLDYSGPIGPSKPGYVQGTANTVPETIQAPPSGQTFNYPATTQSAPSQPSSPSAPSQPSESPQPQGPSMEEINAVFNPQFDFLNQAESALRADQPSVIEEAQKQYEASLGQLDVGKERSEREIDTQATQASQRKESAMDAAARLYNELVMGGRQRFGGASSAGRAYGELSAREFQRQQGDIRTNYETASQQIAASRVKVEEDYNTSRTQLELQKNSAMNQIRRDFQNKLMDIQRLRGEAESAKAQMRLEALQALRNQVFAIELQNQQFQQQLELQRANSLGTIQTAEQNLLASVGGATSAKQQFATNTTTTPQSLYSLGNLESPTSASSATLRPTGAISTNRDEDLLQQSLNSLATQG